MAATSIRATGASPYAGPTSAEIKRNQPEYQHDWSHTFHFGFPSQTWPDRMFPAANTGALYSGKLRDTAWRAIEGQFVARVTAIPKNKT